MNRLVQIELSSPQHVAVKLSRMVLAGASLMAIAASNAQGQAFNFDFGVDYQGLPASYGAASGLIGSWNDIVTTGDTPNVVDVHGNSTAVTLTLTADVPFGRIGSGPTSDDMLLRDNFYSNGGNAWSVALTGLVNTSYDVYYYAASHSLVSTGTFDVNGESGVDLPGDDNSAMINGVSWQLIEDVPVTTGTMQFSSISTTGIRGLAGIQLAIPEVHWTNGTDYWDTASNWDRNIVPNSLSDVFIDPVNGVDVFGPYDDRTVPTLYVGAQSSGAAELQLQASSVLTVNGLTTITSRGRISGAGILHAAGGITNDGEINLGTNSLDISGGTITNNGTLAGNGNIDNVLVNSATGEVRVAAGERMQFTNSGTQTNAGRIEAIGNDDFGGPAEIEFDGNVQNAASTGLITGRSATLRFNDGLTNAGALALSFGISDVFGDLDNTGTMTVSGGAQVTFFDDVAQNGTMTVAATGGTTSGAVIFGDFTGGGFGGGGNVFFYGDLRPGSSPGQVTYGGNAFLGAATTTEIELGGLDAGSDFDQLIVTGDITLDGVLDVSIFGGHSVELFEEYMIVDVAGSLSGEFAGLSEGALVGNFGEDLFISYVDGDGNDVVLFSGAPIVPGDANGDGHVDGLDYLEWAANYATHPGPDGDQSDGDFNDDGWIDGLDYLLWAANYGQGPLDAVAVPEPGGWVLLLTGGVWIIRRRQ